MRAISASTFYDKWYQEQLQPTVKCTPQQPPLFLNVLETLEKALKMKIQVSAWMVFYANPHIKLTTPSWDIAGPIEALAYVRESQVHQLAIYKRSQGAQQRLSRTYLAQWWSQREMNLSSPDFKSSALQFGHAAFFSAKNHSKLQLLAADQRDQLPVSARFE